MVLPTVKISTHTSTTDHQSLKQPPESYAVCSNKPTVQCNI